MNVIFICHYVQKSTIPNENWSDRSIVRIMSDIACLVRNRHRVQVGGQDFYIDLLFYNRALSCLVPVELKIGQFKPEHIGQINFYLEALDRDVKKPNENPSVGVILCATKDDAVVEYALSRSMSPTLVSDYTLYLPDKNLLQSKLRELTELALECRVKDEEWRTS